MIIYDASLSLSEVGANKNKVGVSDPSEQHFHAKANVKFYRLQLINNGNGSYTTHTRWGRVGERGQSKDLGPYSLNEALRDFDKKFKDKTGRSWDERGEEPKKGKYTRLETNYDDDNDDQPGPQASAREQGDDAAAVAVKERRPSVKSKLPVATQSLMELIFNEEYLEATLTHIGYSSEKLPLGKLSKATLKRGFELLKEIEALLNDISLAQSKYETSLPEVCRSMTQPMEMPQGGNQTNIQHRL